MARIHSTLVEVAEFLERYPPFSSLTHDALAALARTAEIEYFPHGTTLMKQEGPAAQNLYTVLRGSVELLDREDILDVLEEGESFGHPSVISGAPPVFTARAREDTLCYLFPAEATVRALADPAGLRFVVASLERRLQSAETHATRPTPWGVGRVGDRARAAPVLAADTRICEAAAHMTATGASTVVVRSADGSLSLVSDSDLRARVVTGDVPADAPLAELAREQTLTVAADRLAFDVAVDMLEGGVEHALVVDPEGGLVGVVDHVTLLDLRSPSPVVVRREIERAQDAESVAGAVRPLPGVVVGLLDAGAGPLDVLAIIASATDSVTRRLTELVQTELGDPPASWAWLSLGSEARQEQTLATDQDNALAYEGDDAKIVEYFAAFATRMNDLLANCGYAECRAGVMARNPGWRLSRNGWVALFKSWITTPTKAGVHVAMIALDVRQVAGPLTIQDEIDELLRSISGHPYFIERLTRAAVELRPPLGFLRDLVVEHTGEHAGTLDLKTAGTGPIVNLARRHALAAGSAATSTVARLRAAAARDTLPDETAVELEEAFITISRVRLEHQAAQVERGDPPDNHVDPNELAPLERRQLKEAFRAVARAQRALDIRTATRIP